MVKMAKKKERETFFIPFCSKKFNLRWQVKKQKYLGRKQEAVRILKGGWGMATYQGRETACWGGACRGHWWKCLAESWKTSGSGSTGSLKSRRERGTASGELLRKICRRSHTIPSPAPLPASSHGAAPPHPALNQTGLFLPEGRRGFPQESKGILHPEPWGSLILIPHLQLPAPGLHSLGKTWICWRLAGPREKAT